MIGNSNPFVFDLKYVGVRLMIQRRGAMATNFTKSLRVCRIRRGFTLLEAIIAAGILLGVVVAVTTAITAGQQQAYEAHERVAAVLAAEALLGHILSLDYASLPSWDGYGEAPGNMLNEFGSPMPDTFGTIGRLVTIENIFENVTPPGVNVKGKTVHVRSVNASGRVLIEVSRFVAEPQ